MMDSFSHYRLHKTEDGYELVLYLNERMSEFSDELGTRQKDEQRNLKEEALDYTRKHLPNLKVKAIKVVAGTLLITSFGFLTLTPSAEASASSPTEQTASTTYTVVSGDTLSQIAARNGTTVDAIKTTNNLTSDFLRIGQTLSIPAGTTTAPVQQTDQTYVVVSGDTLSQIAARNGTTVDAIKTTNNLTSDFLRIGQTLSIPAGTTTAPVQQTDQTYVVVSGDTLSQIAARNGTTVDAIKTTNNLTSDFLRIGQVLVIPTAGSISTAPTANININEEELEWLAKMIHAEARGESKEGQVAVGAVILNRVNSDLFPNSIQDVLFEKSHGHYQFSPAGNGALDRATPNEENYEAARRALSGEDPTNGSLFFYNPDKTNDEWVRSRTVSTIIGNHVFAH
ncbi:hypothetical protein BKP35_10135 [Anaerobacillus arseniciselenatis]|uniref:LysM domain-containing protein n=2 Tax=Anaerobacillus arseniciselenatis TaxID=85682 RepID=A0A1S2LLE2_9BACI|nr:hypothetical protein BKP35_10135 [Anaerobacillus arseniciselenatis]